MTSTPRVTIIISTYNRRQVLLEGLHSLQRQTMPDFECFVLDDGGSTDGTPEAMQTLVTQDKRFRYWSLSNEGSIVARNIGIREANAPLLLILDDDVELVDSTTLAFFVRQFEEDDKLGILGGSEYFLNDKGKGAALPALDTSWRSLWQDTNNYPPGKISRWGLIGSKFHTLPFHQFHDVDHVRSSTMVIRLTAYHAVGGFVEAYTAKGYGFRFDAELCVRIKQAGWRVVYAACLPQTFHKTAQRQRGWQRGTLRDWDYARYTNRNNTFFFLRNYWDHPLLAWIFLLWDMLVGSTAQPGLYRLWQQVRLDKTITRACLGGKWWGWRMYWQHKRRIAP